MFVLSVICANESDYQESWSMALFSEQPINGENLKGFLENPNAMMRPNWRQIDDTTIEFRSSYEFVGIGVVMLRGPKWLAYLNQVALGEFCHLDGAIKAVEDKAREVKSLPMETSNATRS